MRATHERGDDVNREKKDAVLMPGRPKLHAETARHGQEATLGRG